jgi:GAF domain-containing protein
MDDDLYPDYHPDDLEVRVAELLVATADESDAHLDASIREVLRLLRDRLTMDVVFVSEFVEGERVFRQVEQAEPLLPEGASDPLEASWCQRVVDGRLPNLIRDGAEVQRTGAAPKTSIPIGTHLSVPVVLPGGEIYGTVCCFSFDPRPEVNESDLKRLRYVAELTATRLNESRRRKEFPHLDTQPPE